MGIADSFGAGANAIGNMYQTQMLHDQLQQYPQLLQAQLQNSQAIAGQNQNTLNNAPQTSQANIGLTNAQATQAGANAGYINTEASKNQFLLNNQGLMIPGVAGQMAGIGVAQQLYPAMFGMTSGGNTPVTSGASTTGQMLPASNPNQGGLAAVNPSSVPLMMQGVTGGGLGAPTASIPSTSMQMPAQPQGLGAPMNAPVNPLQQAATGNGQMFGGNPVANQMMNATMAPILKNQAQTQWYNARTSGFNQLGPDGKTQMIAQTNSFGYDPATAAQLLTQGYTLQQLGAAKGYNDPNSYPPGDPSPTPTTNTRTQLRNSSMAELDTIQQSLTPWLAPYSQRLLGYSPVQLAQALSGSDPDAQAKFLAAKMLVPDLNGLRAKVASAQFGIGMSDELQTQAMNDFKSYESAFPPAVYAKAQVYAQQVLGNAVDSANKSIYTAPGTKAAQAANKATSGSAAPSTPNYSDADIAYTANKYGMTVAQVKQKLGVQ